MSSARRTARARISRFTRADQYWPTGLKCTEGCCGFASYKRNCFLACLRAGEGSSEICLRKARVVEDFIESHGVPGLQLVQGIGRHLVESAGFNGSFEFLINHSGSPCLEHSCQVEHLHLGELLGEIHDFGGAHLGRRNHRTGVMTNIPSQSGSMQQFANPLAPGGFFGLEQVGNSINTITPIPEPGTWAAAALLAGGAAFMRWRKRKQVS